MKIEINSRLDGALIEAEPASCFKEVVVRLVNVRAKELGLIERFPPAKFAESDGEKLRKALFEVTPEDLCRTMKLNSPGR